MQIDYGFKDSINGMYEERRKTGLQSLQINCNDEMMMEEDEMRMLISLTDDHHNGMKNFLTTTSEFEQLANQNSDAFGNPVVVGTNPLSGMPLFQNCFGNYFPDSKPLTIDPMQIHSPSNSPKPLRAADTSSVKPSASSSTSQSGALPSNGTSKIHNPHPNTNKSSFHPLAKAPAQSFTNHSRSSDEKRIFSPVRSRMVSAAPREPINQETKKRSGSSIAGVSPQAKRAKRKRKTPEQLAILEKEFKMNPMPNKELRDHLSAHLGLTSRQVQIWFQNKRAKVKNNTRNQHPPDPHSEITNISTHTLSNPHLSLTTSLNTTSQNLNNNNNTAACRTASVTNNTINHSQQKQQQQLQQQLIVNSSSASPSQGAGSSNQQNFTLTQPLQFPSSANLGSRLTSNSTAPTTTTPSNPSLSLPPPANALRTCTMPNTTSNPVGPPSQHQLQQQLQLQHSQHRNIVGEPIDLMGSHAFYDLLSANLFSFNVPNPNVQQNHNRNVMEGCLGKKTPF